MQTSQSRTKELFDEWPEKYDNWFATPIGALVKRYEAELLLEMLAPQPEECILDVGCGTGIFTQDVLSCDTRVIGLDISIPMLQAAMRKSRTLNFQGVAADMSELPFAAESFDKVYSMTALEFVADPAPAVAELDRVTKTGGTVVLTTLNSLSPWADRRKENAKQGHSLFSRMTFRSPREMSDLAPAPPTVRTAIHFLKDEDPVRAEQVEAEGQADQSDTGAFVALCWNKV
jgi:ubiquinone/menaquinone biosynthesis C-methylase UbiE